METGHEPMVNTAAYLAKSVIYNNREKFMASLMVAGWDKVKGGQVGFVYFSFFSSSLLFFTKELNIKKQCRYT